MFPGFFCCQNILIMGEKGGKIKAVCYRCATGERQVSGIKKCWGVPGKIESRSIAKTAFFLSTFKPKLREEYNAK